MSQTTRQQYSEQIDALLADIQKLEAVLATERSLADIGRRVMRMNKITRLDGTPAQMNWWRGYNKCLERARGEIPEFDVT